VKQTVISNGVYWILLTVTGDSQITIPQIRVTFKTSIPSHCLTQLLSHIIFHLQVRAFPCFTFFCFAISYFKILGFNCSHIWPNYCSQGFLSSNIYNFRVNTQVISLTKFFFKLQIFVSLLEESNLILDLLNWFWNVWMFSSIINFASIILL